MSIGFQAISEEAISGQRSLDRNLVQPGTFLPVLLPAYIREVAQKWPDEAVPPVFHPKAGP